MSKRYPVSASKASMNLLMFMALLFVGWSPSPLYDLAAAAEAGAVRADEPASGTSRRDPRPDQGQKTAADPSQSSRSFAFSTPTREWLRISSHDTPPEHFLFPGSLSAPAMIPAPCPETLGRNLLPPPGTPLLSRSQRAPPTPLG